MRQMTHLPLPAGLRAAKSGRRPEPAGLSAAMLSAEVLGPLSPSGPRPSLSWPLPKLPMPGRPRLPLPIRAAACRNCGSAKGARSAAMRAARRF